MKRIFTILCVLTFSSYVIGAAIFEPAGLYQNEVQTVKITWTADADAVTFTTNLVYTPSGGTATNFGSCTKPATGVKEVVCTGVKVAVAETITVKNDAETAVDIGTVIVTAGQTLSSIEPTKIPSKAATDVTFTFGKVYQVVPTIEAVNTTTVAGASCALDATVKSKAKCSFNIEPLGIYKVLVNKVDYTKTLEVKGSYLVLSLSAILILLLF